MSDLLTGWLLDVYADSEQGVVLWLLGDDGGRHRLRQPLTTTFYAAGPFPRLRQCWQFIRRQRFPVQLARTQSEDLCAGLVDVMAVMADTAVQPRIFRRVRNQFPDLDYYDADLPVSVQYTARFGISATLRCQVTMDDGLVSAAVPLDSPWHMDNPPPLRVMTIAPDVDPARRVPSQRAGFPANCGLVLAVRWYLRRNDLHRCNCLV